MKATAAIAVNVFRESVRDKVLYNLVVFAILMMGASYLLGQLTAGQDVKIIKDLGLSAVSVFGLFFMRQAMLGVPDDYLESARVEGCPEWRVFTSVALPMVVPSVSALAIFTFGCGVPVIIPYSPEE